jgi:hypothetical protein
MEVSGQLHFPTALLPGKEPPLPIRQRAGWAQSRSDHGDEEKNSQPPPPIPRKKKNIKLGLQVNIMATNNLKAAETSFILNLSQTMYNDHHNLIALFVVSVICHKTS